MKIKWKKIIVVFIMVFLIAFNSSFVFSNSGDSEPTLTAKSAILIDNRTNKILYGKNEEQKMYPASTTKIVTAILTIENANLDDTVTASYDAVMSIPDGYSTADIQIGENLTVEQLLEVLLVHSANDAANVLAEYIGGSIDSFVSMMNTKVHELGLENTHFTNSYGKHDDDHYTTAYDLAKIMQYCIQNETFRKIAGQASCAIPATNMHDPRLYTSTNELLLPNSKFYTSSLTAGKTGYTSQSGECLVSSSYQDNLELICVILGCSKDSNNRFTETKKLYGYGYSTYSVQDVVKENDVGTQIEVSNATKETKNLDLLVKETIPALVKNSESSQELSPEITLQEEISAPIEEGTVLGKITYNIEGVQYSTDLIASHNVEKSKAFEYAIYTSILIIFLVLVICKIKNKLTNFRAR